MIIKLFYIFKLYANYKTEIERTFMINPNCGKKIFSKLVIQTQILSSSNGRMKIILH